MAKCVEDLFEAVKLIDFRYYNATGIRNDDTEYKQRIEHSFTAELYHRYKTICELHCNVEHYRNLILHFDISKVSGHMRPDLVLHEAQENTNNQKMIVEIKTNPELDLNYDINKLIDSIEGNLHFENGVLLVANRPIDETKRIIEGYFHNKNKDENLLEKLFLINTENKDDIDFDHKLKSFKEIIIL